MKAMPQSAAVKRSALPLDRRFARRHAMSLLAEAAVSGESRQVRIHDISHTGFLAEASPALGRGEQIAIDLPDAPHVVADVVWREGMLAGCNFRTHLSRAQVSAARLKSQAAELPEPEQPPSTVGWTLGVEDEDLPHIDKYPLPVRLSVIVAAAALCWAAIIALAWWLLS